MKYCHYCIIFTLVVCMILQSCHSSDTSDEVGEITEQGIKESRRIELLVKDTQKENMMVIVQKQFQNNGSKAKKLRAALTAGRGR